MVGTTALEVIQERLEEPEEGEKFSNSQLMALVELAYDRSVAPSKSGKGMVPAGMAPPPPQINIQLISPSNRPGTQTQTVNATALEPGADGMSKEDANGSLYLRKTNPQWLA